MKSKVLLSLNLLLFLTYNSSVSQQSEAAIPSGVLQSTIVFATPDNDSVACYRIPAVVTAPNGDIVVAIDERVPSCGDLKWSTDINIVIRRSSDNGLHWSAIERIIDFPEGQSASDPSMIVDSITNEIILFYNFMDLIKEKDVYYLHTIKSTDNGKTWSEPVDITPQITKPEWHNDFKFITSGRGIQTRSGSLVHCMVNLDNGMHLFASDNHGESWYLIPTPILPANESKIVELNDGSWMINSRVEKQGLRHIHQSEDQGKSWNSYPDEKLIDPGCNASIIRYSSLGMGHDKNRLLFVNAADDKERRNLTIRISYDEGKSWSASKTLYKGSAAYSTMTVLNDGSVGVVFEKDNHTQNQFVRFTIDWLTDGQDKGVANF